jgi:outer membrane biosynthesis protein TonB
MNEVTIEPIEVPKKPGRPKKQPAPKPPETAQPSAEPESVGPRKFRVKHQDCDAAVFTAVDRVDAIEQYKRYAGIRATPHPFAVTELKD